MIPFVVMWTERLESEPVAREGERRFEVVWNERWQHLQESTRTSCRVTVRALSIHGLSAMMVAANQRTGLLVAIGEQPCDVPFHL